MTTQTISNICSKNECEWCGETNANLLVSIDSNPNIDCYYCNYCFFGCNDHIKSFPLILYNDNTHKCHDCDNSSEYNLKFQDNTNIYLCNNHIAPNAPYIKSL